MEIPSGSFIHVLGINREERNLVNFKNKPVNNYGNEKDLVLSAQGVCVS